MIEEVRYRVKGFFWMLATYLRNLRAQTPR
jgi:hypothetical protein